MLRDPVADWRELSALYERAELLQGRELQAFLDGLGAESRHLAGDLERMLRAKAQAATEGFLETLPGLQGPAEPAPAEWGEGSRVGAYRLVRHIGSGGMAEVWLADRVDGAFERKVAIKLLFNHPSRAQRETFVERFKRERDILASLDHPNIARLHDAGVTPGGQPWLALEYVEGRPITAWCDERRLMVDARVLLFRQVLLAVEYAHANLVIHRDLKPANILVTEGGEVRLLDFGIAKLLQADGAAMVDSELTSASGRPLTPQYASPEQLAGRPLTTASDTYSLGVVFYELILGTGPYDLKGTTAAALEAAIAHMDIEPPSRRRIPESAAGLRGTDVRGLQRALRPDLDAIALRALQGAPSDRYESVAALRSDMDRWRRHEAVLATVPGPFYRLGKFARRHRVAVATAGLVSIALLSAGVVTLVQSRHAQEQAARALASKEFLLDMLRQSDPTHSKGGNVSASELLDAGLERAGRNLRNQPELHAEVLLGIANINRHLGRYTEAQRILGQAGELYGTLGRPRDQLFTRIELADNALQLGDAALAASLLDAASAPVAAYAGDAALQARYRQIRGWLARAQGDLSQAQAHMKAAWTNAVSAYGTDDNRTADALRGLAWVEADRNEYGAALEHIELARVLASRAANATAMDRIEIDVEQIRIQYYGGQLAQAHPLIPRAKAQCDEALGPQHENCVYLHSIEALLLLEAGSHRDALKVLPSLLPQVGNDSSPWRQAEATVLAARILAANRLSSDRPDLGQKLQRLASGTEATADATGIRTTAMLGVAEVALRAGRFHETQTVLREFLAASGASSNPVQLAHRARARCLNGLALQLGGQHADAIASLGAAEEDYEKAFGRAHTVAILCRLNQIPSLLALGEGKRALALADEALPVLRQRLPPGAPVVKRVEQARSDLQASAITIPTSAGRAVFFNEEIP